MIAIILTIVALLLGVMGASYIRHSLSAAKEEPNMQKHIQERLRRIRVVIGANRKDVQESIKEAAELWGVDNSAENVKISDLLRYTSKVKQRLGEAKVKQIIKKIHTCKSYTGKQIKAVNAAIKTKLAVLHKRSMNLAY